MYRTQNTVLTISHAKDFEVTSLDFFSVFVYRSVCNNKNLSVHVLYYVA